ncbi:MAG: MFS transporter [Anaerolineae bacterium]|jgi:fucose permease|nr:MFS transporter [Anaerolineae bacterium]
MKAETLRRDGLTWLAYLMLAFYGYFLNVLGPITPFLQDELRLSYTLSSLHFTAFAAGILLVGFGGHLVVQRLGRWRSLWVGAAGVSLNAVLLLLGRQPAITIAASFLMGLIGSLILAIVPAALSDRHGERRSVALSEANVISSLVSTAAPLLVGWSARWLGSWRVALGAMALTPALLYAVLGRGTARESSAALPGPGGSRPLPALFWINWLGLVLAISVEFCMIFWSANYFEGVVGMPKAGAAQAVSLFLAAMILGRVAGSRLVTRFAPRRLVVASSLLALAGFLAFWGPGAGRAWAGLSGLFLTGLGVANLYPLILSQAMGAAGERAVQASARATLASGTAILALPLALGRLADIIGLRPAYGIVALLLALILVVVVATGRKRFFIKV